MIPDVLVTNSRHTHEHRICQHLIRHSLGDYMNWENAMYIMPTVGKSALTLRSVDVINKKVASE